MRDINAVLKLFSSPFDMDYCADFDRIKSILEYCNDHIKTLSKVHFRGGNENLIKEVINRIRNYFIEEEFLDKEFTVFSPQFEHNLRKITFFLVLNTDASFKYDLKQDQYIGHTLNVCPQLPKCLLVNIIWGLNLDVYFYECLRYTPIWFGLQFLEASIQSIKYLEAYDGLDKVDNLVKVIIESIYRSDFRTLDLVDKKIILNKFYDYTADLMRQFYTPDFEKFSNWSKVEFFKYSGYSIKHLLDMVLFGFDVFTRLVDSKLEEKHKIYEICTEVCLLNKVDEIKNSSEIVKECLQKIFACLLNSLQYNIMLVTVEVFVYWVEIDCVGGNLQAVIGERAYRVINRIQQLSEDSLLDHDIEHHLQFIAIKPKSLPEIVRESRMGEILTTLDDFSGDYKDKKIWFDELFNRPIAFDNDECVDTITANTKLVTVDNCFQILDYIKLKLETDSNYKKLNRIHDDITTTFQGVMNIILKSLQNFNCEQLQILIAYEHRLFGVNADFFTQPFLNERLIELFNKSTENFDILTFLCMCYECSDIAWTKFFNEACTSEQLAKAFSNTIVTCKNISNHFIPIILDKSFPEKCEEKFYPNLLFEIYQSEIIPKNTFFKTFVYTNVVEMLEIENYDALICMLKTLNMIANKNSTTPNFGTVTAPVIVMASQIMEKCRWDLVTYTDKKDEILRITIEFIQNITKKFLPNANEKDKKWIADKVSSYRLLTKYYFQKFTLKIDEKPKKFDRFLNPEEFSDENEAKQFLTSTFVRCTLKETEWLAKSERLQPHFSSIILLLEDVINTNENGMQNFRHCIANYANIVKKFLIPIVGNDREKISELGFSILEIIAKSPRTLYDDIFMSFQGILLEVFQKSSPIEEELIKNVRNYVSTMKDCKGKELFHEKFQAMAIESLQ